MRPIRSKTMDDISSKKRAKRHTKKAKSTAIPPSTKVDDTLAGLQLALEALENASKLAPIPYLSDAASAALFLLGTLQNTRDNQATLKQLAQDSYNLIVMIYESLISIYQKHGGVSPRFLRSVERLANSLHDIEVLTSKLSNRTFMARYFMHKADQGKIADCERALRSTLNSFQVESSLSTWAEVEHISSKPRVPVRSQTLFTVTDNSKGHKYIAGGGTIIQEHGLKIISSASNPSSPICMSPDAESKEPAWLENAEAEVINASSDHQYDTSGGGQIRIRHGVTFESTSPSPAVAPS